MYAVTPPLIQLEAKNCMLFFSILVKVATLQVLIAKSNKEFAIYIFLIRQPAFQCPCHSCL